MFLHSKQNITYKLFACPYTDESKNITFFYIKIKPDKLFLCSYTNTNESEKQKYTNYGCPVQP